MTLAPPKGSPRNAAANRVKVGGPCRPNTPKKTVEARVRPNGQVLEIRTGAKLDSYPFRLPGRPITGGESWTYQAVEESQKQGPRFVSTRHLLWWGWSEPLAFEQIRDWASAPPKGRC